MSTDDLKDELGKHPIFHAPPIDGDGVRVVPWGEGSEETNIRFYCYRDVLEELKFASTYHGADSVSLLTGQFGIDRDGPFLEVTGFESFQTFDSWDDVVSSLREGIDHLLQVQGHGAFMAVERLSPVGFFVHRADGGAMLEPPMIHTHLSLFNIPFQVVLVMDVEADQVACYARVPHGTFFNAGIQVVSVLDDEPEAALEIGLQVQEES